MQKILNGSTFKKDECWYVVKSYDKTGDFYICEAMTPGNSCMPVYTTIYVSKLFIIFSDETNLQFAP